MNLDTYDRPDDLHLARGAEVNPVARVGQVTKQGANAWRSGFFDRMPLTDLDGDGYWAGYLNMIGRSLTSELLQVERIVCLSEFGVNMLQQRLTCHLTRAVIPTATFNEAFSHTFEEADLLENWTDTLIAAGWTQTMATTEFESFLRAGDPSLQTRLLDAQQRSSVRRDCRHKATALARSRQKEPPLQQPTGSRRSGHRDGPNWNTSPSTG